jgi:transcriptional regulator with AAA-type ATPase domain
MSKQSEAKERQQYVSKIEPAVCMNCAHYESSIVEFEGVFGGVYKGESNKRCGIGGFAVKKMGTCIEWAGKVPG